KNHTMSKKVILGFSGGLDTSYCVKYFTEDKGYEVHTVTVNTGGFDEEEAKMLEEKALSLGAKSHKNIDVSKIYYEHAIKYLVFGNVLKNGTYPISVSSERMTQAQAMAEYALTLDADAIAHGSTGAG